MTEKAKQTQAAKSSTIGQNSFLTKWNRLAIMSIVVSALCALCVMTLSCASTTPTLKEGSPAPKESSPQKNGAPVTTLTVALYPYVPRLAQFQTVIAQEWAKVQPNVTLQWATNWDGGYSSNPDPSYDVFVFDALNLGYFQAQGYLYPMSMSQVPNYGDIAPFAAQGVTSGNQVLAIPQLGCGDFLFYRTSDIAIANATTASALAGALGTCTYYTETPQNASTGLMVDFSGGTTDASIYVESLHEQTGQFPIPLPSNPTQLDPTTATTIQGIMGLSSFANALFQDDSAPYQRATWFGQGNGRAYVGFTESMSQIDPSVLPSVSFKPMPWSNNLQGTQAPLFFSDVVGVGATTVSRGTTSLAIQLANIMTSPNVIVAIFGASGRQGPQYLMPVSTSALATLASQYPMYKQMATVLQGLQPILFNLGANSKGWLASMKRPIRSMVLASPLCYSDFAAPPIANNQDAQITCPTVCARQGGWNGQWTNEGGSSVCGCDSPPAARPGASGASHRKR